jgi:hypothetical protein
MVTKEGKSISQELTGDPAVALTLMELQLVAPRLEVPKSGRTRCAMNRADEVWSLEEVFSAKRIPHPTRLARDRCWKGCVHLASVLLSSSNRATCQIEPSRGASLLVSILVAHTRGQGRKYFIVSYLISCMLLVSTASRPGHPDGWSREAAY